MTLLVLVPCDDLEGLARTSGSLDAQTSGPRDVRVAYLTRGLDAAGTARLDHLVSRRPHLAARDASAGWSTAARQALHDAGASRVLVLDCGDVLHPGALEQLAGTEGTVAVRRSGSATGTVLATADDAEEALPDDDSGSATTWVAAWRAAVPAGAAPAVPLLAAGSRTDAATLALHDSALAWEGGVLTVRATVSPTVDGDPVVVLANTRTSVEQPVETSTSAGEDRVEVTARIDVRSAADGAPLPDGDWDVWVQVLGADRLERVPVPRQSVGTALVGGRPVVPTARLDELQLQVGRVRRAWFRPDPAAASITEGPMGTALGLPLTDVHVGDDQPIDGSLHVGGLRVPATVTVAGGRAVLQAWLSGLAGEYPLSVDLGHARPTSLGLTLSVDGVGAMRLTRRRRPAPSAAPAPLRTDRLAKVRERVPAPVVQVLAKVPGVRSWYAGRQG